MSQYQQGGYGDQTRRVDEYGNPVSQQLDQFGNPISSGGGLTGHGHGQQQQHHGGVDQTTGFGTHTGSGTGT
ncbi:hypothetical protein L195_g055910, partial [Trifolium pratense]